MADPDLNAAIPHPEDTVVPASWFDLLQEDIRTAAAQFDGSTAPTAAQVEAGRIYSRSLDTNGDLRHALKEATGASSGETDWKALAARVAVLHVLSSLSTIASTIAAETADTEGRKLYRPGQFVLNKADGGLFYLYDDKAVLSITQGYHTHLDELAAERFIPTGAADLEQHAGSNGAWNRLVFPDAVTSQAYVTVALPNSAGNYRVRFRIFGSSPASSGTAKLEIGYRDVRPGDTVDSAEDGTVSVDLTSTGAGQLVAPLSDLTSVFRVDAGRRLLRLRIARLGGDAGDTLADDLHIYGLRVEQLSQAANYTT